MHLSQPAFLLALAFPVVEVMANRHGQGHGPRRRYNDDESITTDDLELITDAPGPPTIQPGIPALQPSIPTSGVASLSIPPAHQTSISKHPYPDKLSAAYPSQAHTAVTPLPASPPFTTAVHPSSVLVGPTIAPKSTTSSIPFLSELMSQLFSRSSEATGPDTFAPSQLLTSSRSGSSTAGTLSTLATNAQLSSISPAFPADPKDYLPPASTPSMLVYSFTLPPYTGGLDTAGIVETMTQSSPVEGKDDPAPTVYSYNLPPYIPKVPTYVATSAVMAAPDMTSGAPGSPGGAAPTNRIFLQQGLVDPTKDPVVPTSSVVPVYSPACLGNAYGGGYVITPTIFVANSNATGDAKIPPAYGFSYKLEPTQSPGYGGAVIIVDTKNPGPTGAPSPKSALYGSHNRPVNSGDTQVLEASPGARLPPKDVPQVPSKDLVPTPTGSIYDTSAPDGSILNPLSESIQSSRGQIGSPSLAKDDTTIFPNHPVPISSESVHDTNTPSHAISSLVSRSTQSSKLPPGSSLLVDDNRTVFPSNPLPISTGSERGSSTPRITIPVSVLGSLPWTGAITGDNLPAKDRPSINSHTIGSTTTGSLHRTDIAGNPASTRVAPAQSSRAHAGTVSPGTDASAIISDGFGLEPHGGLLGTNVPVPSLLNSQPVATGYSSIVTTHVTSVTVTTVTTWCPSTAPDHLSILSSIPSVASPRTALFGGGASATDNSDDKMDHTPDAHIDSSISWGAVTISKSTFTATSSLMASIRPQDQLHRAAIAFDSTTTDSNGAVSTEHASSQINGTLTLPGNGSSVLPFQGTSSRLTASATIAITVISFIGVALGLL